MTIPLNRSRFSRRRLLQASAAGAGTAALASHLPKPAIAQSGTIRIGYVSPQTGPLAPFGEADSFVLAQMRRVFADGLEIDGTVYAVEIIDKDSQSNPNRAAEVAGELILDDEVNLMLVASTPETTNPVSDQCEINGVACISSVAPWQPWFFTRGGDPVSPFQYTYHFFWGLEDVIAVFTHMWDKVATNRKVGGLFPNDGDGNAWGDPSIGFPPVLTEKGYSLLDPGRYQNLNDDFTSYISAFKEDGSEIVTGVMIPPDFTTFWTQAKQQGFTPKVASVGKAILFPVAVEALGDQGHNLSSEVWWTPTHPFASSLTGQSCADLAAEFESETGKQWTQPIGFVHALFEVAAAALRAAGGPDDADAIMAAVAGLQMDSIVGRLDWTAGPVPNVAKTPLVGGQWRFVDGAHPYDIVITSNETAPDIPLGGEMEPIV
ncbi:MAG: ABC transporter substrate-binding protein [Alphaproteobacteria bacterium]